MKTLKNKGTILFLSCGLIACNSSHLNQGYEGQYFRFDSLMSNQYELLLKEVNLLERTTQENGLLNNYQYEPDARELADELNVLFEIDPNHPDYDGLFQMEEKKHRLGKEVILTVPDSLDLPLKKFRYTQFNDGNMEEVTALIEAFSDSANYSKKYVFLEFWNGRLDKFQTIESMKVDGDTAHYVSTGLLGFKESE